MKGWRLKLIFICFLLAAGLIAWRLFNLQIKKGEAYSVLALGQMVSFEERTGERGDILLADNILPLATNKNQYIAYISPKKASEGDLANQAIILADILAKPQEKIYPLLGGSKTSRVEVNKEQYQAIIQKQSELPGVSLEQITDRFYPHNSLASQALGFLNQEGLGQYGLEDYYNDVLSGEKSLQKKEKLLFGFLPSFESQEPTNSTKGDSLTLTLDYKIQSFTEKLLEKAYDSWEISGGQIIVQSPQTGAILAMASWPSFDPNHYADEKDMAVFSNPCLQKLFEPGSILKPSTMAAALEEELIEPNTTYIDKGCINLGGPDICNFNQRIWGKQTMTDVLEESINTGAVFAEQELGAKLFLKYLDKFGFFEKTNIDLEGEVFSENEALKRGYARDLASASFGQGIALTPIQIIRFFSGIANNGIPMKPYIVSKATKENGQETLVTPEEGERMVSEETSIKLISMMVSVIEQGSARNAKIPGYWIAGKTGTAQVPKQQGGYYEDQTIQSFVGIFPALAPQYVVLVKLDNPQNVGTAGYCAAPLFKELAEYIINIKEIPPDHKE